MAFPDDPDDESGFVPPLHPDDRLWRHPSEMAASNRATPAAAAKAAAPASDRVHSVGVPRVWTVAAASVLLGVAATLAILSVTGTFDGPSTRTVVEQVEADPVTGGTGEAAVTERVGPALVRVDAIRPTGTTTATGVVYRSDGHLLTTAGAVDGATSITVTTADGSVLPATLVGVDDTTDIAVLDVDRNDMTTAVMARVSDLAAGEQAITVERDPDATTPAVASGHVSALGLRIDTTDGSSLHDMIQAALETSPSSAGAVLCTGEGAVLGLVTDRQTTGSPHYTPTSVAVDGSTTTTSTAPSGMATLYATPIDYASQVADELIDTGTVRHTWLGVLGDDLDPGAAAVLGRSGATLTRVMADGPAAAAGLQEGDVVLALDGVQTTSMSSLVVALRSHRPGDVVAVTYVRDGDQQVAMATLTTRS
jgi:putative serine protease PepD